MSEPFTMSRPCQCGHTLGVGEMVGPHEKVTCAKCRKYVYFRGKTESGRAARSVSTVHAAIKPAVRARVILRAGNRCELCGKPAAECATGMHVGHLLSVADGLERGLTDAQINSEENLAATCDECNLGLSDLPVPLWLAVALVLTRLQRQQGKAS